MHPAGGEPSSPDVSARAHRLLRATEREVDALRDELAVRRGAAEAAARRAVDHADAERHTHEADLLAALSAEVARIAGVALDQVRELCSAVDGVVGAMPGSEAAGPPPQTPPASAPRAASPPADAPGAPRLVAIEMAIAGATREEVGRRLRERFGLIDSAAVLDGVFGPDSGADSRLAPGR